MNLSSLSLRLIALLLCLPATGLLGAEPVRITKVEPTIFFPIVEPGQPLMQTVQLGLDNSGDAFEGQMTIALQDKQPYAEEVGTVAAGASVKQVHVLDVLQPSEVSFQLYQKGDSKPVATRKMVWQPQKKWKIYCVSYSHHDLGFGNYPHRLRTNNRHANIERPLKFCAETDDWDDASKFRFVIETSEPITSFLGSHSEADAAELARRIREGRIQLGAVHNTANTEQLSHELLARLFYLTNRHTRDLLGVPPAKTAQIDDVIGLTWPLATFCKEAGVPYFFHGRNSCADCLQPASSEAVFYWQGPDGDPANKVLMHSRAYGSGSDSLQRADEAAIQRIVDAAVASRWPYDALLSQDGSDFSLVTMDNAHKIHNWNAKWAYPRLICATMDMFFDSVAAQVDPARIKTFAKDSNNQWADQDSTDAWLLGLARRQGEAVSTAEKLSTIAVTLAGGAYPWTDIYKAYHSLLQYHEHTNAAAGLGSGRESAQYYETELEENREIVQDAQLFSDRVRESALERLAGLVATQADKTVIVFNPLNHVRTDLVRVASAGLGPDIHLVDTATGKDVPHQRDGDEILFVAADVPSVGYKSFRAVPGAVVAIEPTVIANDTELANRFYRVSFDPTTGAITSIIDKELEVELVDRAAPHQFNEYLYERFETPNVKDGSRWYRVQSARLQASAGPVAGVMTVKSAAVGAKKIEQAVILYNDLKRIDFVLDLLKSPSGRDWRRGAQNKESVYVTLPFAIRDFRFHHEVPGAVEEPIRDLFYGACTAYYATRHFSDVSNSRYGVTVSATESALVEYGHPRSCPIPGPYGPGYGAFEKDMTYPANSRMYLYLMNNMFDCNIRLDQRGPIRFTWSVRSHPGDWKAGLADQFGWDSLNPLIAKLVTGKKAGPLAEAGVSFLEVDPSNVVCTTMKPAEANGRGIVLRFVETHGVETIASFRANFCGKPAQAFQTSLLEEDTAPLRIDAEGKVAFTIRPFGVRTIRLVSPPADLAAPSGLEPKPLSDVEVELVWKAPDAAAGNIAYYHVYRGSRPDFRPTLLNLVHRCAGTRVVDRPMLHFGGWIANRLEPETTYYYRVSVVDRWNNEGPLSPAVPATTLKSSENNAVPNRVEGLRAILVSPLAPHNYVNLLFRTNCESDVTQYEVHRCTEPGFAPDESTRIGLVDANATIKGSGGYGHAPIDRKIREFDHIMYQDDTVEPLTTYYYRIRAVDAAEQKGPFSNEASVTTRELDPVTILARTITAQSVYAPEYGKELAVDNDPDPYRGWISKQYGGGTREKPLDVWWAIEFPGKKRLRLQGVKIFGDHREIIPLQKNLQVQIHEEGGWKTVVDIKDAQEKDILATWAQAVETDGIRVFVPAADLPRSAQEYVDGIVRICELLLVLPDGTQKSLSELFP